MIFHSYVSLPEGINGDFFIATFDSRNKLKLVLHTCTIPTLAPQSPMAAPIAGRLSTVRNFHQNPLETLVSPTGDILNPRMLLSFIWFCHLKIGYPRVPLNTWCFLIILSLSIQTLPYSCGKYPISYAISHYTPIISPVIVGPVFMLLIHYIIIYWFYIPWRRVTINYLVWYHSKPMFNANIIHFKWL